MNFSAPLSLSSKVLFQIAMKCRRLLPKKRIQAFGSLSPTGQPKVQCIYVINLDRQPTRWVEMEKGLRHVLDWSGTELWSLVERFAAVDAISFTQEPLKDADIDPIYTLGEQLFVEPQPLSLPTRLELNTPIRMSRPEVAVARSHIDIWRQVAAGKHEYVLILEDDVWFQSNFALHLDQAWNEIREKSNGIRNFHLLYVSYEEVKNGCPKTFLSDSVFRPVRGLWHLSGYILSRDGAKKLLQLLPCRGPVDLWINHQFDKLNVLATRQSIVNQRLDVSSTNSYSILPALTKIGAITSESASLFHVHPTAKPVFAFGPEGSGLTSLAMALSMLGYRCCSDLKELPSHELEQLLTGKSDRVFDAYVNIGFLTGKILELKERYPQAKFIVTAGKCKNEYDSALNITEDFKDTDIAILHFESSNKWQVVCEHLNCVPPTCSFPELTDLGQRELLGKATEACLVPSPKIPKRDKSPWVVESRNWWQGIWSAPTRGELLSSGTPSRVTDCLEFLDSRRWFLRNDTFTDNMALFRPANVEFRSGIGVSLCTRREPLGVREYSAASLTSRTQYLFGRFEATIQASNVPGIVTGFFLHRDSPRQEIDFEITGNRTDRLLVNVFYNPGDPGAKFDYGYRGAASYIDLGFDASESSHRYAIEWEPCEIRWLVDDQLVHRRVEWDPTPIPQLPMALHINTWPSRSKEFAGRLTSGRLPATTLVRSISLEAQSIDYCGVG